MLALDRPVGAHLAHQFHAVQARTGRNHPRPPQLGELDSKGPNSSGPAVNQDGLALLDVQCVIDSLQRGQPGRRDCAGMLEVEPLGHARDLFRRHSHVFRVEATFGIGPTVGIYFVANLQPAHPRPDGGNHTGAVHPEHQRKARLTPGVPALAHVGIPLANPGRVEGDQHLPLADGGNRHVVQCKHLRSAEMINRGRGHGMRDARCVTAMPAGLISRDLKLRHFNLRSAAARNLRSTASTFAADQNWRVEDRALRRRPP
jgi:hypothetical protein